MYHALHETEIARLGRRMQTRQQALATAQLYIRRFYTKVPIRDTNPYLVMATCLYLALKMEECPQHIRIVVSEARTCWPGKLHPTSPLIGSGSPLSKPCAPRAQQM